MTPAHTLIALSPSAQILLRDDSSIQFGLDASRAGIVELPNAAAVARVLGHLDTPTPVRIALDSLVAAGCDPHVAQCLLGDLLAFGILRPSRSPAVVLVGHSALARHLTRLLRAVGIAVRIPLSRESLIDVLSDASAEWPVVLVDQFGWTPDTAAAVASLDNPLLCVTALDARGMVGPVRTDTQGPCPMCVELHWVRQDPAFVAVAKDFAPERQDPVTVAATSASAVAAVQALVGIRSGAPSATAQGDCLVIDPHSPDRGMRFSLATHDGCPVCFEAAALSRAA